MIVISSTISGYDLVTVGFDQVRGYFKAGIELFQQLAGCLT
jgi:hypothetical protein